MRVRCGEVERRSADVRRRRATNGRELTIPLVNIVPFKPGLMRGERLFYDAAMIYERAGLDVHELRAAASRADA